MKRYIVVGRDFDSRPALLSREIQASWESQIKELHLQNQHRILEGLLAEYGSTFSEIKLRNFIDLGNKPFSVVAFHNKFLDQIRDSFVLGAYYPALTGACALGERILNHLLIQLRDSFKGTIEYKKVYDKRSFDDWNLAINTLETWGILLPDVVGNYRKLAAIRNTKAIHFNPETDQNDRDLALESIQLLFEILANQFSAFGSQPWFIPNTPGACFIKKTWEEKPFIQSIYIGLSNCLLVGPYHKFHYNFERHIFTVRDDYPYESREITDEEFAEVYNQPNKPE